MSFSSIRSKCKGRRKTRKAAVEKLQNDLKELEAKKGELALPIANSPSKSNAQIVLDALKDFSEPYESFQPAERSEYLQRIIRDIVVTKDKVLINIYGLSKPPSSTSKKHVNWVANYLQSPG